MSEQHGETKQTVRVPADLSKPLRVKMAESDVRSFQVLVMGLLQGWLEGAVTVAQPPTPPPEIRRHQEWHEKLDLILDHGEQKDIVGIQANLDWGAESVTRRTSRRRAG